MRRMPILCLALCLVLPGWDGAHAQSTAPTSSAEGTVVPASPSEGGPRRWRVTAPNGVSILSAAAPDARQTAFAEAGALLSNMGCRASETGVWCAVRPMRGGPRGFLPAVVLEPATGPDGVIPMGEDQSRRRAERRDFDAEGSVPCAQEAGEALGTCQVGVARTDGGDATLAVTFTNGFTRLLFFAHGEFISASTTMSGNGTDTDWKLVEGTHTIRVDDQRFEISDALIFGSAR